MNDLKTLIETKKISLNDIDYYNGLSYNRNLDIEFIKENINQKWDWREISQNPGITLMDIIDNPDLPWDYYYVSKNNNLSIEFIKEHIDWEWDWDSICRNSGITMRNIRDNPNLPWNYETIFFYNRNLDIESAKAYNKRLYDFTYIYSNPKITMRDIRDNPDLPWCYSSITNNPNIDIEFVKEHRRKFCEKFSTSWYGISSSPSITMKDIRDNPDLPWHYYFLSENPNLNIEFIREHIKEKWNWREISVNPGITMTDIRDNPDLPWDYNGMSRKLDLDIEFVLENIQKNWDWRDICRYNNFSLNYISKLYFSD